MAVEPMATNNRDYWAERALTRENEAYLRGANLSGKMFREYEAAAKSIRRQIDSFYSKYAGKYGLTYDQAVRLLNRKEFQEWKAALGDYVATIKATTDPSVKAVLKAQLDALSANSSISRLEALQGQIDLILNDLWKRGVEQMKEELGEGFVEGYTRTHKKGARASAGTSIEHRPEEVNARTTVGHWEMDSVLGKKKTKPALLVLSERLSRKELIIKVQDHTAASVVRALDRLERKMGSPAFRATFKSITVDNGSEFADVDGMERSCRRKGPRTKVYYCHPYSSWERGTNENTNGLIRRWFPKGTDFSKVSVQEIQKVEDWLNTYPREILGFLSADAVFSTAFAACV